MKLHFITFLWALLILSMSACNASGVGMVLEKKDVQFFKVSDIPTRTPHALKISGLAFHSALAVEKISTITEGQSLTVFIHLVPAKPGLSGSFEYELTIPDSISDVKFGNEKVEIWNRKAASN